MIMRRLILWLLLITSVVGTPLSCAGSFTTGYFPSIRAAPPSPQEWDWIRLKQRLLELLTLAGMGVMGYCVWALWRLHRKERHGTGFDVIQQ